MTISPESSSEVQQRNIVVDLLELYSNDVYIERYSDLCVEQIKANRNIFVVLHVLHAIVSRFSKVLKVLETRVSYCCCK